MLAWQQLQLWQVCRDTPEFATERTIAFVNGYLDEYIDTTLRNTLNQQEGAEVSLGDYLCIKGRIGWKGLKKSEYLSDSDYRIINGKSLTMSGIDWNKAGCISKKRYDASPEIMLEAGDILLSKDGIIGKLDTWTSLKDLLRLLRVFS